MKLQNITVIKKDCDMRLDRWFKKHFPSVSHVSVEKALRKGQIRVNGKRIKANHRIQDGEVIRVPPMVEYVKKEKKVKPVDPKYITMLSDNILFKDQDIIVINKPAGLASQGGTGINISVDALLDSLKFDLDERPKLVHRLDKDTSGILVIARHAKSAKKLGEFFKERKVKKTYWAFVVGTPDSQEGKIDMPILKQEDGSGKDKVIISDKGNKAITFFRLMENMSNTLSLVELSPITGRTHQLRVHMAEIGLPILGDGKYGGKKAFIEGLPKQLHLHARQINLPTYDEPFQAELTGTMKKTFKMFNL